MSERARDDELLLERAIQLARPPQPLALPRQGSQLLLFRRAGQLFALDLRFVRELLPISSHIELPFAPAACLGLVGARGELYALFELPLVERRAPLPRLMLLCGEGDAELALAIDEALELVEPGGTVVDPGAEPGLCAGVDPRGFMLIEGAALLSDPRLLQPSTTQEKSS
ncbi:MAG TPA: chemotaxis protein CheW [Polyangiales bacterium]